jgi:hypothetical protein
MLADDVTELCARGVERSSTLDDPVQLGERLLVTRPQDGFLVGEVVVQCGLPNAEVLRDVVERGAVESFPAERPQGCVEDFLAAALTLGADVRGGGDGVWTRRNERLPRWGLNACSNFEL